MLEISIAQIKNRRSRPANLSAGSLLYRFFLALFSITITLFSLSSSAQTKNQSQVQHLLKLTVVTEFWPPYNYVDANNEFIGSSTDWVKAVLADANVEYDITQYPWSRAYQIAQHTPNVLIYSMFKAKEREAMFDWLCPLPKSPKFTVFKLAERDDIEINSIADIENYTVSVVRDSYPHIYLKSYGLKDGETLKVSPSLEPMLAMIEAKRVDLLVGVLGGYVDRAMQERWQGHLIKHAYSFENPVELCMGVSKNTDKALLKKLTEAHQHQLSLR